jgi:hypothetical protein
VNFSIPAIKWLFSAINAKPENETNQTVMKFYGLARLYGDS